MFGPSFQGEKRLFLLSFENNTERTVHPGHYLLKLKIKGHNVMIDSRNIFDENLIRTYEDIKKNYIGKGDDYTTGGLRDYLYLKEKCRLIEIDLNKQ